MDYKEEEWETQQLLVPSSSEIPLGKQYKSFDPTGGEIISVALALLSRRFLLYSSYSMAMSAAGTTLFKEIE